jgi:branched-chain amino acid transport system substrate-binding protein
LPASPPRPGCADDDAGRLVGHELDHADGVVQPAAAGPSAAESRDVLDGQKLALLRRGAGGPYTVKLSSLDASTAAAQGWDPERTAENARRALRDRTTIAYLGESSSGATAISLPILNASGIPQVSPQATYTGFTQSAGRGEPERYYPAGVRSFARVVPPATAEAAVLARGLRARDCARVAILEGRDLGAGGLARNLRAALRRPRRGVRVVASVPVSEGRAPADVARDVAEAEADCAVYVGGSAPWVPALLDDLHAVGPGLWLLAGSALAHPGLTGELDPGTQARLLIAAPVPAGGGSLRAFRADFRRTYDRAPSAAAAYGHASMQVVLRAIAAAGPAGGGNRREVRERLLGLPRRPPRWARWGSAAGATPRPAGSGSWPSATAGPSHRAHRPRLLDCGFTCLASMNLWPKTAVATPTSHV